MSAYTVPAGYRAAFVDYRATASNASPSTAVRVQLGIMSRAFGSGIWRRNRSIWLSSGTGVANVHLDGAIIFEEKTDIVLRALAGASADNLQMTASMELFLIRN